MYSLLMLIPFIVCTVCLQGYTVKVKSEMRVAAIYGTSKTNATANGNV